MKTVEDHAVEILRDMLKREPTQTEIGNVTTDTNIMSQATLRKQSEIETKVDDQASKLQDVSEAVESKGGV